MKPTPCETCEFVHLDTRRQHPGRWLCVKYPRLENLDAVAPTQWIKHEPYNRCVNINLGFCPLWAGRRTGKKDDVSPPTE